MAYQMAAMAVHRLQAFSNAAFYTISTDSVLMRFLCISRASSFSYRNQVQLQIATSI